MINNTTNRKRPEWFTKLFGTKTNAIPFHHSAPEPNNNSLTRFTLKKWCVEQAIERAKAAGSDDLLTNSSAIITDARKIFAAYRDWILR